MAANPFEDSEAKYLVLINDEGQHSLWPVFADVLGGVEVRTGPGLVRPLRRAGRLHS